MVEECGGSVTRAMRRLGYPTRQTLHHWLNRRDASHERRSGRPWSHYDPPWRRKPSPSFGPAWQARTWPRCWGIERRGGLQLGESRRSPEPSGGGQEPHRTHERFRGESESASFPLTSRFPFRWTGTVLWTSGIELMWTGAM